MKSLMADFRRDRSGSVMIIFGLSSMVLLGVVGFAVDTSRAYGVASKVQSALDAAALAAARFMDANESASDTEIEDVAKAYFNSYKAQLNIHGATVSDFGLKLKKDDSEVIASANISVDAVFGKLANLSPTMDFTRTAQVIHKTKKIELALVLDVTDSMSGDKITALKVAANDLVDALYASNPLRNAVRVSLVPYGSSVNAGSYAAARSGSASVDDCVVEREGTNAYTDEGPGPSNYMSTSSVTESDRYFCPPAPMQPLTNLWDPTERANFKAAIDGMATGGLTAGHIGLAVGWYTVSKNWARVWPVAPRNHDPEKTIKAVVLMTDGWFNTAYKNGAEGYDNTQQWDANLTGSSGYQAKKLCEAMTSPSNADEKITLFTVGFQATPEAEALLKQCSGDGNFFTAATASELSDRFKDIAERLSSLRVSG